MLTDILDPKRERELIEQCQHTPDAFRELYRHYFPRIFAFVAYRVGRRQDAEDITADIFMNVVKALNQFEYRGAGSFAAWLFRIARNSVSQFYRVERWASHQVTLDDIPHIQSRGKSPDQVVQDQERFTHLYGLVKTLSARRQEIILMRFYGGLRNQEIADVLGLDERTVASHLSRALNDLGRKYHDELEKEWLI